MGDEAKKQNENRNDGESRPNGGDGNRRDGDRRNDNGGDRGQRGNDQQKNERNTEPRQWRPFRSVREWLNARRAKTPTKGAPKFNFRAPGVPDHWMENAIEFVYRTVFMGFLSVYPLLLVYIAAVGFVPRSSSAVWNDTLAVFVSIAINGAYFLLKRRSRSAVVREAHVNIVLGIKTIMMVIGLIYTVFQAAWVGDPPAFAMPAFDVMLFNPPFLCLLALMLADTLMPGFLRGPIMYDDEKVATTDQK
jgi:hypothetical protein